MRTTPRLAVPLRLTLAAILTAGALLSGCVAAAAGAGAGAGIYLTSRGASSIVQGSVEQVADRTATAFTAMGIERVSRTVQEDGSEITIEGETDELEVTVEIEREDRGTSNVQTAARRNLVQWDKEFARSLLERIISG